MNGNKSYQTGITKFSDLTKQEFTKIYLNLNYDAMAMANFNPYLVDIKYGAPSSYDWRTRNIVIPVEDQGLCGSFWAFATLGNLESIYALRKGVLKVFSKQMLIDCDTSDSGCNGGLMEYAYTWIKKNGIMLDEDYPYIGKKSTCKSDKSKYVDMVVTGYFKYGGSSSIFSCADEDEIKQGLGYTVLTRTLQFLKAFMKYYDPSIEEDVLTMFSEIVQDTYRRFGIDFKADFSKYTSQDYPTFSDVYATIKGRLMSMTEQTQERDIMERLELKVRPITKELKFYFDGHTTIRKGSDFMVFNIKELMNSDSSVKNALFFNVLKYAWGLCLDYNVDTVLMVDEAHVLLGDNNALGADFLAQVQRRARKYNTGTIIITQQPSDFSDPSVITQGKAIFDNSSYYLIMGLKKQAVEDLSLLIDLNESEKESIKRYSQGEALFVCGSRRMRINIAVTQDELDSFGIGGGF